MSELLSYATTRCHAGLWPVARGELDAYDLGGANLTWYERPLFLWIHRPQIRSSRTESGTSSERTELTHSPPSASTSSSACAWTRVRGNPSRMNPVAQSGSCAAGKYTAGAAWAD